MGRLVPKRAAGGDDVAVVVDLLCLLLFFVVERAKWDSIFDSKNCVETVLNCVKA